MLGVGFFRLQCPRFFGIGRLLLEVPRKQLLQGHRLLNAGLAFECAIRDDELPEICPWRNAFSPSFEVEEGQFNTPFESVRFCLIDGLQALVELPPTESEVDVVVAGLILGQ
jgi:hypothetical protein